MPMRVISMLPCPTPPTVRPASQVPEVSPRPAVGPPSTARLLRDLYITDSSVSSSAAESLYSAALTDQTVRLALGEKHLPRMLELSHLDPHPQPNVRRLPDVRRGGSLDWHRFRVDQARGARGVGSCGCWGGRPAARNVPGGRTTGRSGSAKLPLIQTDVASDFRGCFAVCKTYGTGVAPDQVPIALLHPTPPFFSPTQAASILANTLGTTGSTGVARGALARWPS